MVSRRKILSQSRDELSYEPGPTDEPEDDVWFTKEKLYKVFWSSSSFDLYNAQMSSVANTLDIRYPSERQHFEETLVIYISRKKPYISSQSVIVPARTRLRRSENDSISFL